MLKKNVLKLRADWEMTRGMGSVQVEEIEKRLDLPTMFAEFDELFAESEDGFARIMRIVSNLKNFSRIDQGGELELYDVNGASRAPRSSLERDQVRGRN